MNGFSTIVAGKRDILGERLDNAALRWIIQRMEKGLVQIYTGDGKGKTTAAFGLGLRAWGRKKTVLVIQFMKGGPPSGEALAVGDLQGFVVFRTGSDRFVDKANPTTKDRLEAMRGIQRAKDAFQEKQWDLVVLDEVLVAVSFGLIEERVLLQLLESKPEGMELVLTGRYGTESILARADLVTEMRCIKHPFDEGLPCREGVES